MKRVLTGKVVKVADGDTIIVASWTASSTECALQESTLGTLISPPHPTAAARHLLARHAEPPLGERPAA